MKDLSQWKDQTPEDVWAELKRQEGTIKILADVLEEVHARKSVTSIWIEDGREMNLLDQIEDALRSVGRIP